MVSVLRIVQRPMLLNQSIQKPILQRLSAPMPPRLAELLQQIPPGTFIMGGRNSNTNNKIQ